MGRRGELGAIKRRLGTARLVTLTGPGGVGKTRLALRTARDLGPHFSDGADFVALAEIASSSEVAPAVATTLGLQDRATPWTVALLGDHLADKRVLLVLDNCEHVLEGVAVLAGTLLRRCPDLQILATSRQSLGIAGEVVELVQPMAMPDPDDHSTSTAWQSDAVTLFVERAAARGRGLSGIRFLVCRGRIAGTVDRDGVAQHRQAPVGAAAQQGVPRHRCPARRAADEDAGPGHGRSEPPPASANHGSDHRLVLSALEPEERLLFERLSVFAGGFEIDAAQEVCADAELRAASIP